MTRPPGSADLPALAGGLLLPELPGALCKGQDPAPWFPRKGGSPDKGKEICRACPARRDCLAWAITADERAGVWGGTSPDERAAIRRTRKSRAGERAAPALRSPAKQAYLNRTGV